MIARLFARFTAWMREEARLATAETWADEPAPEPPPMPCTSAHPDCQELARKQAVVRERMRRMKAGLVDASPKDRPYTRGADVEATFRRVRATVSSPVHAVPARRASR